MTKCQPFIALRLFKQIQNRLRYRPKLLSFKQAQGDVLVGNEQDDEAGRGVCGGVSKTHHKACMTRRLFFLLACLSSKSNEEIKTFTVSCQARHLRSWLLLDAESQASRVTQHKITFLQFGVRLLVHIQFNFRMMTRQRNQNKKTKNKKQNGCTLHSGVVRGASSWNKE